MKPVPSTLASAGVLLGSAVLAIKPLVWLVGTWYAPGYDSVGWVVVALVAAVFIWSASSPRLGGSAPVRALWLLLGAAGVRLGSQVLAVDVIGALTLVVDVYALGLLAGLDVRRRPVSPFWLAVVFAFSLPLEPLLQRLLGFPLQQLSAAGACSLLQHALAGVTCQGTRILVGDRDILVDLPCSGAALLTHAMLAFALLAALRRPRWGTAAAGGLLALAGAWAGNSLRIAVLAAGTAHPGLVGGLDLTRQPWHDLTGLVFTALVAAVIMAWAARVVPAVPRCARPAAAVLPSPWRAAAGFGYAAAALLIVSMTPRPVDVSAPLALPELPRVLASTVGRPQPLSGREQAYFTQYGGSAARASYGPFALLTAGTRSPLRHLHGPEVCLEGAGHDVQYLGRAEGPQPAAVYRTRDGHGGDWRVQVSWISADGHAAASVSEAVWYWLTDAASAWTMIQRITPWDADPERAEEFESGVMRAFNLPADASAGRLFAGR